MTQKSLIEQRAEWRQRVWSTYMSFRWAMLVFVLVGPWLIQQAFGDLFARAAHELPGLGLLHAVPYIGYSLFLVPYVLLMTLPLALSIAGPYPLRARFELNEQLRAAWLKSQGADVATTAESKA